MSMSESSMRPLAARRPSLERLPQVIERTGLSRSNLYHRVAAGSFPAPIKVGRISAWNAELVDRWIDERIRESERKAA